MLELEDWTNYSTSLRVQISGVRHSLSYFGGILFILSHGIRSSSAIFLLSFYLCQINYSQRLFFLLNLCLLRLKLHS